jgi:hypothetical protein
MRPLRTDLNIEEIRRRNRERNRAYQARLRERTVVTDHPGRTSDDYVVLKDEVADLRGKVTLLQQTVSELRVIISNWTSRSSVSIATSMSPRDDQFNNPSTVNWTVRPSTVTDGGSIPDTPSPDQLKPTPRTAKRERAATQPRVNGKFRKGNKYK